jgi:hypothetical protein
MPRLLLSSLFFLGCACASFAADSVALKIKPLGLDGAYTTNGAIALVEVELHNNTASALSLTLTVSEVNLDADATPISETFAMPLKLTANESRSASVPLHLYQMGTPVIYAEARDEQGWPIGRAGRRVGERSNGVIIGLLCGSAEVCRAIRQAILLTGSEEEQTRKSQNLRLMQLSEPPAEGWAYAPARTVIVASPLGKLSAEQRLALEIYLHSGGGLALIEDQLGDGPAFFPTAQSSSKKAEAGEAAAARFLGVYRATAEEGKSTVVDEGTLVHFRTISSPAFAEHFRPLGFSESTPEAVRQRAAAPESPPMAQAATEEIQWLMKRLGTTFRFPTFLELLLWIAAYLLLVGVVNFIILRRMDRQEWGWITIPVLAIVFSVVLYVVGTRNHPKNFGLDEVVQYRLDPRSPLAVMQAKMRISAPSRATVHAMLPAGVVFENGQRAFMAGDLVIGSPAREALDNITVGENWETQFPLRRWSFRDLDFGGHRVFSGSIYRDSAGHFHNDSGIQFEQAIVVDHEDVFLLGNFPPGSAPDLGHVERRPYAEETGRIIQGNRGYPGPPFAHKLTSGWPATEEQLKQYEKERNELSQRPFSVLELIRGWSPIGDDVFYQTRAIFFGLSKEATLDAALRDQSPDHKAYSLLVVTFKDWP